MEKKLQVKDLTISFRTTNGKVQAVRGINFDLHKGETLAIVGESGSGKSVTSKAILGILAGNSIVENGEIIYDGKDLLEISEEDFHKIRGDKIAMIFQDPMSSLNPIVKIGRQLTEAMILKGKARQKESRAVFNSYLALLEKNIAIATKTPERENDSFVKAAINKAKASKLKMLDLIGACIEGGLSIGGLVAFIASVAAGSLPLVLASGVTLAGLLGAAGYFANSFSAPIPGSNYETLAYNTIAKEKCKKFDKFEYKHLELESAYNSARSAAFEAIELIDVLVFEIEKNAAKDLSYRVGKIAKFAKDSINPYVVDTNAPELTALAQAIVEKAKLVKKGASALDLIPDLNRIAEILTEAKDLDQPNFFAMGYYLTFSREPLPELPVAELNKYLRRYLDHHFMLDFIEDAHKALVYSAETSYEKKAAAIEALNAAKEVYNRPLLNKKECLDKCRELTNIVLDSIDRMEITKDSLAYTFGSGLKSEINKYFNGVKKNVKEEARYAKEMAKYERLTAAGREPDSKPIPAALTNLEKTQQSMIRRIERLVEHYEAKLAHRDERNYAEETVAVIDHLKASASGVVKKVTKRMAKSKALKLMEEVGIPDPRVRFNQYPFEFSGGMRQRIVIAIALAADPDILICDEPTTALDVTIQAQILELINKSKAERDLSIIFITHDLGVVANMADRIAVMYAGKIVEYGTSEEIFYDPRHPYTWALLSSMPDLDTNEKLEAIPGTPPNMIYPPVGDAFAARNKYAMQIDFEQQPPMFPITETHSAATWLLHPDAPKVEMPKIIRERIERMRNAGGNYNV